MDFVGPLALDISKNVLRLGVAIALDLEGDIRGRLGFHLERDATSVVVLREQVAGRLAEILLHEFAISTVKYQTILLIYLPRGGNRLR